MNAPQNLLYVHEWKFGWAIYGNDDPETGRDEPFVVYEDHGQGNGYYVAGFTSFTAAKRAVLNLAMKADERWAQIHHQNRVQNPDQ